MAAVAEIPKVARFKPRVLCVDDEPNVLEGLVLHLRKRYTVFTATSGQVGLDLLSREGPFAVVLSDMRMPNMNGTQFLEQVREVDPDSVRMVLTGHADLHSAIEAVNRGEVYRFLTKPCQPAALLRAFDEATRIYELEKAEQQLLEETLRGSVDVLTDILALVSPAAFGRANRIKRMVRHMADQFDLADMWQYELAAMLSQIGCVALPPELAEKVARGDELSPAEAEAWASHPDTGRRLLRRIPRLETVAAIVGRQLDPASHEAAEWAVMEQDQVALGAQMLRAAIDLDVRIQRGATLREALRALSSVHETYNAALLEILESVDVSTLPSALVEVALGDLDTGMILYDDARTRTGVVVVQKGYEVTPLVRERLYRYDRTVGIEQPIRVLVPGVEEAPGLRPVPDPPRVA